MKTAGTYLPYDDLRMESIRSQIQVRCAQKRIPLWLALNYDQVWRPAYRYPNTAMAKTGEAGQPAAVPMRGKQRCAVFLAAGGHVPERLCPDA